MKCSNCGNELKNGELFCPYCGTELDDKTVAILNSGDDFKKTESFDEIVCKYCGELLSEDSKFCKFCGTTVDSKFAIVKNCPFCNAEIRSVESVFCNNCGKRISSVVVGNTGKDKKKELIPYIVLLIAVIICCISIITYVYKKNNSYDIEIPELSSRIEEYSSQIKPLDETEKLSEEIQVEEKIVPPEFKLVESTSTLKPEGTNTYYADNIWDGNKSTAWVEGALNNGIGERISFSAISEQTISGIRILNGYCKNESLYWKNSRVKQFKIIFDSGENIIVDIPDVFNQYYDVKFEKVISSTVLKLEIADVYPGTHYTDTCISEVEIY